MEHNVVDHGRDVNKAINYFFTSFLHGKGITVAMQREMRKERLEREGSEPDPVYIPPKPAATNAERVQRTWSDPAVSAARNTRSGVRVTVNGASTEHRSTFAAFQHYALPESKHVKFRAELKRELHKEFHHESVVYRFEIVQS